MLPLAKERGIAVIANRPFQRRYLIDRVQGKLLPPLAQDMGVKSWPQFLLKFVISHPAITCAIPATGDPAHMVENMSVGHGPMPDAAMRAKMADYVAGV
ncbi:MAG: hypothetical protein VW268_11850 [Rhodospirillaceae bacterium]